MTTFENWCALRKVPTLPAPPTAVAAFVADCAPLGAELVWQALQEVSRDHVSHGYADPTLGGPVALAMNALARIEPPRSWAKGEQERFYELPYDVQLYINHREAQRDRAVRLAQNAAAKAAKKGWIDGKNLSAA